MDIFKHALFENLFKERFNAIISWHFLRNVEQVLKKAFKIPVFHYSLVTADEQFVYRGIYLVVLKCDQIKGTRNQAF